MSNPDPRAVPRGHHETLLTDPYFERDACGTGFVADLHARASHKLLRDALTTIARLSHRGAVAADGKTGDGSGILTQLPYGFFANELQANHITPPRRTILPSVCFSFRAIKRDARVPKKSSNAFSRRANCNC